MGQTGGRPWPAPRCPVTVIIGGSFGAGQPTACAAAPTSALLWNVAPMRAFGDGGEQAAGVLVQVKHEQAERAGETFSAEQEQTLANRFSSSTSGKGHPYYSSRAVVGRGVIDPAQDPRRLGLAIWPRLKTRLIVTTRFGVFSRDVIASAAAASPQAADCQQHGLEAMDHFKTIELEFTATAAVATCAEPARTANKCLHAE